MNKVYVDVSKLSLVYNIHNIEPLHITTITERLPEHDLYIDIIGYWYYNTGVSYIFPHFVNDADNKVIGFHGDCITEKLSVDAIHSDDGYMINMNKNYMKIQVNSDKDELGITLLINNEFLLHCIYIKEEN